MDTAQIVISLLGVGTIGTILGSIVSGLIKWLSGTAGRERSRNADMRVQRNEAWADAERERERSDRADRNQRRVLTYAARLERMLTTAECINIEDIPPFPSIEEDPPQAT